MDPFTVIRGDGPIVLGMPHTGTWMPEQIFAALNPRGQELADTDWHVNRLYDRLLPRATTVRAMFHRYLIDANRDPSGASLYPGQNTTGLVPMVDFDGAPIWQAEPDEAEIAARREAYHAPYHAALRAELERVRALHGVAILFDCHSIRSEIPFLFEGRLPDFNIGDNEGRSCARAITGAVEEVCAGAAGYTSITNGRFKGGWTTRHYGAPEAGIHAIQMELAQATYMQEAPPWTYLEDRANTTRTHLKTLLNRLETMALDGDLT